jgi:hypothetical protein
VRPPGRTRYERGGDPRPPSGNRGVTFTDPFGLCPPEDPSRVDDCKPGSDEWKRTNGTAVPTGDEALLVPAATAAARGAAAAVRTASAAATRGPAQVTVVHFTSAEGAAAIEGSGALRAGSYVTVPQAVAGRSAAAVEGLLEIQAGRGAMNATISVPADVLRIPLGGPLTSGGAVQFQLIRAIPVSPGTFVPTP